MSLLRIPGVRPHRAVSRFDCYAAGTYDEVGSQSLVASVSRSTDEVDLLAPVIRRSVNRAGTVRSHPVGRQRAAR